LPQAQVHKPTFAARLIGAAALFLAVCATPPARADACSHPLATQIANSCVVTENVLWRGAKPDVTAATELIDRGVRVVVNLELAHDDRDAFRAARPALSQPHEIEYFRVRDWEPNVILAPGLLDRHVAAFIAIMRSQPKPIYVHCRSGQNRTGVMVAAYRVLEENVPVESAISEMAAYQGIWFKNDAHYIRQLTGKQAARLRAMATEQVARLRAEAHLLCTSAGCAPQ
jgi:tyrosine-protein phosphatase SIW14